MGIVRIIKQDDDEYQGPPTIDAPPPVDFSDPQELQDHFTALGLPAIEEIPHMTEAELIQNANLFANLFPQDANPFIIERNRRVTEGVSTGPSPEYQMAPAPWEPIDAVWENTPSGIQPETAETIMLQHELERRQKLQGNDALSLREAYHEDKIPQNPEHLGSPGVPNPKADVGPHPDIDTLEARIKQMSEEEIVNRLYELMSDMNPGNLGPQNLDEEMSSSDFRASEPMDLAFRLLKVDLDYTGTHTTGPLRNQQELGDFDVDFPHTQGPVVAYHGKSITPEMREIIAREGIIPHDTPGSQIGSGRYVQDQVGYHPETGQPIWRDLPTEAESGRYPYREHYIDDRAPALGSGYKRGVDAWNRDIPVNVSVTDDASLADSYAHKNYGHARDWDPAVYGVRAAALANQLPLDEPRRRYGARGGKFDNPAFYDTANTYRFIPHNIPPEALIEMTPRQAQAHDQGEDYYDVNRDTRRQFDTHGGGKAYRQAWDDYRAEVPGSHSDEDWRREGFTRAFGARQEHVDNQLAEWQQQQAAQQQMMQQQMMQQQMMMPSAYGVQSTLNNPMFQMSEPMDLAFRLLKEDEEDEEPHRPYTHQEPVSVEDLRAEAELLQDSGHTAAARRFRNMANAMEKPDEIRNRYIRHYAQPLMDMLGHTLAMGGPEELYEDPAEQRRILRVPGEEGGHREDLDPETRAKVFSLLRRLEQGAGREQQAQEISNQGFLDLMQEDPTQFFRDRQMKLWEEERQRFPELAMEPWDVHNDQQQAAMQARLKEEERIANLTGWDLLAHQEQQRMAQGRPPLYPGDEVTQVGKSETPIDHAWKLLKIDPVSLLEQLGLGGSIILPAGTIFDQLRQRFRRKYPQKPLLDPEQHGGEGSEAHRMAAQQRFTPQWFAERDKAANLDEYHFDRASGLAIPYLTQTDHQMMDLGMGPSLSEKLMAMHQSRREKEQEEHQGQEAQRIEFLNDAFNERIRQTAEERLGHATANPEKSTAAAWAYGAPVAVMHSAFQPTASQARTAERQGRERAKQEHGSDWQWMAGSQVGVLPPTEMPLDEALNLLQ